MNISIMQRTMSFCFNNISRRSVVYANKKYKSTKHELMTSVVPQVEHCDNKVTVIGVGQVGMACAFSCLTGSVTNEIILIDNDADKLKGEMLDMQHGSIFMHNARVSASTDYAETEGSKICIITAGARQREGESRLDLVQRNTDILKDIIPRLLHYNPNTILLMVTNPVDILTYVAYKVSQLPKNQVIGSGTNLDSSRFRFLMSQRLGCASTSCHGWVIGEHGDTSVPVWSGVNVAGVRLREINPRMGLADDPEKWGTVHDQVVQSAYEVIKLKGYTSWAIGLSVSVIVNAILKNSANIHAVSTHVQGYHGITEDVFLSLPCILGHDGVTDIIKQRLTDEELEKLHNSTKVMDQVQKNLII